MSLFPASSAQEPIASRPEHSPHSPMSVHALTVAYRKRPVIWAVDLDLRPARMTAIVGPNGAGKSTLLKACLGLIPPVSGAVAFWGSPIEKVRARVAYVPQRESVDWDFPISSLDVVAMGRYPMIGFFRPVSRAHRQAALAALDRVGMADFAHRQIGQLSGGQQQRVFVARALAQEPDLYVLDEPLAGVDATTERIILKTLHELRDAGKSIVCVHHDLQTVREAFDDAVLLNVRLVATGPVTSALTQENLHRTYAGRLPLLEEASRAIEVAQGGPD